MTKCGERSPKVSVCRSIWFQRKERRHGHSRTALNDNSFGTSNLEILLALRQGARAPLTARLAPGVASCVLGKTNLATANIAIDRPATGIKMPGALMAKVLRACPSARALLDLEDVGAQVE